LHAVSGITRELSAPEWDCPADYRKSGRWFDSAVGPGSGILGVNRRPPYSAFRTLPCAHFIDDINDVIIHQF